MSDKISLGIDIGTYQIKAVVAESVKSEGGGRSSRILGTGFAESKGLRHGYILNTADVTRCVKLAASQAEKAAKVKLKKAYISVGGIGLSSLVGKGSVIISRADSEITDLDVRNVLAAAENEIPQSTLMNKKVLHSIPIGYKIDDQAVMGRPTGMHGIKLEVRVLFIVCLEQHLNDLIKAVEDADIDVVDVMAAPLAGSIVSLSKTQKIAGCVLANIGSETVSIVVFENNIPISLEVFPIGSTDITNDIALGFRIPIDEAENIKTRSNSEMQFSKKKLDDIIMGRLSDIFDLVEAHLKKISRSGLLPAGIILTGGGSGLGAMIEDMARVSLKIPSKIASLNLIASIKNSQIKDASWSVSYGLAIWGLSSGDEIGSELNISSGKTKKFFRCISDWFKQFLP